MQFADFNAIASVGALGFGLMQVYFFLFVVLPAMRGKGCQGSSKAMGRRRRPGMGSAFACSIPYV